ncbi:MAG: HAD family hydrolase [Oscillospiraceae bacterium]|nr:HAD family hydrolase [Oscillospiraceae bacterium]
MKYTDLIFDLYGTLLDIHTDENDEVWEKTALYFGYYGARFTADELRTAFLTSLKAMEATAGQSYECYPDIPIDRVMAQLLRDAGITDNTEALGRNAAQLFRICSTEYIRLYPDVPEALEYLRARGFRLWLLSNAQRVFTEYELRHLGIAEYFEGIYISSDHGFRKPDLRFFKALIDSEALDPKRSLMIGNDRETDIEGAKKAGLDTLYMHTNLTPAHQKEADAALSPASSAADSRNYEFEGCDWIKLSKLIAEL